MRSTIEMTKWKIKNAINRCILKLLVGIFLLFIYSNSNAQVYYHYAWNEKALEKLLPVRDTVTVLSFGRQLPRGNRTASDEDIDFPDTVLYFTNLRSLKVGMNTNIKSLASNMEPLNKLERLDICLFNIGPEIKQLKNLKTLTLFNTMSEIPKEFGELKQLESLYINNDSIKKFPESIFELSNVKTLQISMNNIDSIPEGLSKLEHLEELHFYCGGLIRLPSDLAKIKSLKKIILDLGTGFDYTSSFKLISESPSIEAVEFTYTYLEDISSLSILQNIKSLKISTYINEPKKLNAKLAEIAKIKNIELLYLDLSYPYLSNNIKTIPDSIRLMTNLKTLTIENSPVDSIPSWATSMKQLELIHIKGKHEAPLRIKKPFSSTNEYLTVRYGTDEETIRKKIRSSILSKMQLNDTLRINYFYWSFHYGESYEMFIVKTKEGMDLLLKLVEDFSYKQTGWVIHSLTREEIKKIKRIENAKTIRLKSYGKIRGKRRWAYRLNRNPTLQFESINKTKKVVGGKNMKLFLELYNFHKEKAYPAID